MNNRINMLFESKKNKILSVYFTAGFPCLEDTAAIIELLEKNGVDMVEIGIPFSDPIADGPEIQHSNDIALKNGMSLELLFHQLTGIRKKVRIPLVLMGYVNPVLHFGVANFCRKCRETGIDGTILPDLPLWEYTRHFRPVFEAQGLLNILLIAPQTPDSRIREIDAFSKGFIYMVSSSSTTGTGKKVEDFQTEYFERVQGLTLQNPCLIGFGISDKATFNNACRYASGAIIGSAFIRTLQQSKTPDKAVMEFVNSVLK